LHSSHPALVSEAGGNMTIAVPLRDVGPSIPAALQRAVKEGALYSIEGAEAETELAAKPMGLFYDLDAWEANMQECKDAFGEGFFHALALKSNAVTSLLCQAHALGFGAECASMGEVLHAQRMGLAKTEIVFDSPVKTAPEIRHALSCGIHLNIDNMQELEVVAKVHTSLSSSTSDIGLRVNPLVGAGQIAALSVSTPDSKFGVPINSKTEIIAAFKKHDWLNCIHVHVGSGGMGVQVLTEGVGRAVELALEINKTLGSSQVQVLDMGGGMPVNYAAETWYSEKVPSFAEYAAALRARIPALFPCNPESPFRKVITEFGQSLNAKAGWLASRIEYIKPLGADDAQIALIHFGAETCVRQCYSKEHHRRLEFYDGTNLHKKVVSKTFPLTHVNVAGPLCFQGDVIAKGIEAPRLCRDDVVVLRDAGSNTVSLFSRHCLRQVPAVYGYRSCSTSSGYEVTEWKLLKPIEDIHSCMNFWGPDLEDESQAKKRRINGV